MLVGCVAYTVKWEKRSQSWPEYLNKREHLGDLGVGEKITLNLVFDTVWTRLSWIRIVY